MFGIGHNAARSVRRDTNRSAVRLRGVRRRPGPAVAADAVSPAAVPVLPRALRAIVRMTRQRSQAACRTIV
jgi:hypothetical protein